MANYADSTRTPRTLTEREQRPKVRLKVRRLLFTDKAMLAAAENAIFSGGGFTGVERGTERLGLVFEKPIGARVAADGTRIPLFYGEAKVGANGLYHVIPRTGPSLP